MLIVIQLSIAHFENDNYNLESLPIRDGSIINVKSFEQFIVNLLECSFGLNIV